jgi:hypothetical protein
MGYPTHTKDQKKRMRTADDSDDGSEIAGMAWRDTCLMALDVDGWKKCRYLDLRH